MKESSLSGASPPAGDGPGSSGEELKGFDPELAVEWQQLKSELKGWGEGAFASLLLV